MKKFLVIILVIAVAMVPAVAFSYDEPTALEKYIEADTLLSSYIDDYADLLLTRDEDIAKFESRRTSYRNFFYAAQSLASRDNSILQVDFNIENKLDSILARKAQLTIDFRTTAANLYTSELSIQEANQNSQTASNEYNLGKKNVASGFLSENELLQLEYNALAAKNIALMKERQYESSLRSFNFKMDLPIEYDDYQLNFDEKTATLNELEFYIDIALENSPTLKTLQQALTKYYTEKAHYDVYSFSTNLSYINDILLKLDINIKLQNLMIKKNRSQLIEKITDSYSDLLIELDKINLAALYVELLQTEYNTNKSLYDRGLINREELSDSAYALKAAKDDHMMKIYRYNTNIKSLEHDCAYYPEEGESE